MTRKVRMEVTEAPTTWKGIATLAATGIVSMADALLRIADELRERR